MSRGFSDTGQSESSNSLKEITLFCDFLETEICMLEKRGKNKKHPLTPFFWLFWGKNLLISIDLLQNTSLSRSSTPEPYTKAMGKERRMMKRPALDRWRLSTHSKQPRKEPKTHQHTNTKAKQCICTSPFGQSLLLQKRNERLGPQATKAHPNGLQLKPKALESNSNPPTKTCNDFGLQVPIPATQHPKKKSNYPSSSKKYQTKPPADRTHLTLGPLLDPGQRRTKATEPIAKVKSLCKVSTEQREVDSNGSNLIDPMALYVETTTLD